MESATAEKQKKEASEVLDLKNMIGGEFVDPVEGKTEDVVNPATGEVIAHAPLSTEEDVDRAVKAARQAFETWQYTTPSERQQLLLKLADGFQERADEITDWETRDAGKPRQAMFDEEIPPMVDQLRFFAGAARTLEGRAAGEYMEGHTSIIRREAVGVVGQITPRNYPLKLAVWKIGPALATV
jgi:betaine-aldehyde dehydrogenase